MNRWLVFNIGCIECGVSSNVVGVFPTQKAANDVAEALQEVLEWREGGENHYRVYDMTAPMSAEYAKALIGE